MNLITNNKTRLGSIYIALSTLVISIASGHGIVPMLFIQFWSLSDVQNEKEEFVICSLLFLVGQILIIISGWAKKNYQKTTFILGITSVSIGILFLYLKSDAGLFTLISSIPFIILAYSTNRKMNVEINTFEEQT